MTPNTGQEIIQARDRAKTQVLEFFKLFRKEVADDGTAATLAAAASQNLNLSEIRESLAHLSGKMVTIESTLRAGIQAANRK